MSMDLGPYAAFIIAAYVSALGIVAALIAWIMLEQKYLVRLIEDMEARGVARRSRQRENKP
jgi:heme exporter protein D